MSSSIEYRFLESMPPLAKTMAEKVEVNKWFSTLTSDEKRICQDLFLTKSGPQKDLVENFYPGRRFLRI